MFATSDSNLALPLAIKPAACKVSRRRDRAGGLEIPLWVKPSGARSIEEYIAIVPLHHAKATQYLAEQRELALQQKAASMAESDREANSTDSTDNTINDDFSNESSNGSSFAAGVKVTEESSAGDCQDAGQGHLSRTEVLVEDLHDARQQARARRVASNAHIGCASEGVIDDTTGVSRMDLVAAVRNARENAASRRLAMAFAAEAMAEKMRLRDAEAMAAATASEVIEDPFAVTILTVTGACLELDRVHSDILVGELVERVANAFKIPNFAVRLMWGEQILHMSQPAATLQMVGIEEGAQLTLVKNFGWAKPDVTMLHELPGRG
jgi:hypothetical protein